MPKISVRFFLHQSLRNTQDTQKNPMELQETSNNPKELKEFEMTRTWRSKPITRDALWLRRASKNHKTSLDIRITYEFSSFLVSAFERSRMILCNFTFFMLTLALPKGTKYPLLDLVFI